MAQRWCIQPATVRTQPRSLGDFIVDLATIKYNTSLVYNI